MIEADYKKLSLLIQKYCPGFLADKYPKFISFLKAYYDWSMNVKGFNPWRVVSHIIEWGDIDETLDEFIDYFKEEYLNGLNIDFNGDVREFIKHTKEFYSSRGTPESFRFLLKLLSGNTGEVFYPNRYLMKSSDGVWRTDHNIFVEYTDELDNSFISTKIKGKYTGASAIIEAIETHFNYMSQDRFLKLYISNIKGDLTDDIIVFQNDNKIIELPIYKTIKSVNIIDSGNNYKIGDSINIEDDPTFICRVSSVSAGKIDSYAILDGGSGYAVGDIINVGCDSFDYYYAYPRVYVDEVDPDTGAITSLDIRYPGYGFLQLPYVKSIDSTGHLVQNKMVPAGYTALDWIENDGITCLNTNVALDENSVIELKFLPLHGSNPDIDKGVFGAEYLPNIRSNTILFNEESSTIKTVFGQDSYSYNINFDEPHYVKRNKNKLYIDNVLVHEDQNTQFNTINGLSIFATSASGSHNRGKSRIYFARVYNENGEEIANYVPARRDSDNKIGMFDTVSQTFLTNEVGETDFIAGPDAVIINDAVIEFISDGCGSINTVDIINVEIGYTDGTPLVIHSEDGFGASLNISTGIVFNTIPYYYQPGSFLSDEFKLQDSDYWQEYSYEIRSSLSLESDILAQFSEYKEIFKQLVHPAGFKLFNSFILSNHISLEMLYINSTIEAHPAPSFIDLVNWIELVSHWNRIMDWDILFQHRFSTILSEQNTPIGYYHRTGGEFVHSTLSSSGSNRLYAWTDLTDPSTTTVWTDTLMPLAEDNLYGARGAKISVTISSLGDNYLTDNRNIRYTRNSNGDYVLDRNYSNFMGAILTDVDQSLAEVVDWNDEWRSYSKAASLSLASSGVSYNNQNQFVAYNNADYYYDGSGWAVFYTDLSKTTVAFYARRFDTSEYKSIRGPGLYTIANRTQVYAYRPLLGETEANKKVYLLSLYTYAMYLHPAIA